MTSAEACQSRGAEAEGKGPQGGCRRDSRSASCSCRFRRANYRNLASVGGTLYYIRQGSKDSQTGLSAVRPGARKETALGSVNGFEISADGKKMLVSQDGKYGIIDLPKGPVTIGEALDLSGMEMRLDRHQEWQQIFTECWRQMRDFFYDPNMHGVDWKAMRTKYEPLVPHVSHRADLTYVIGEMIAELNAGHTYVGGGDMPQPPRIPHRPLGAELRRRYNGLLQDRQNPERRALGPETAFSPGRTRRRRERGRIHHRRQWPADQRNEQHRTKRSSTRSASR